MPMHLLGLFAKLHLKSCFKRIGHTCKPITPLSVTQIYFRSFGMGIISHAQMGNSSGFNILPCLATKVSAFCHVEIWQTSCRNRLYNRADSWTTKRTKQFQRSASSLSRFTQIVKIKSINRQPRPLIIHARQKHLIHRTYTWTDSPPQNALLCQ